MKQLKYAINRQLVIFTIEVEKELSLDSDEDVEKVMRRICSRYTTPEAIRHITIRDGDQIVERLVSVEKVVTYKFFVPPTTEPRNTLFGL